MKQYLLLLSILWTYSIHAQSIQTTFKNIPQIDTLEFSKADIIIPLQFGEMDFVIKDSNIISNLSNAEMIFIKMYYSKFPQNIDYQTNEQKMLNDGRVKNLFGQLPFLTEKKISLEAIRQDKCKNEAEARKLFHGFLITYQKQTTAIKDSSNKKQTISEQRANFYKQYQHFNIKVINNEFATEIKRLHVGKDSSSFNIFERNFEGMDSIVIVADWTSSMYPYTLQVLTWQVRKAVKSDYVIGYVFFNDGNTTPNQNKQIGNTGGIYISKTGNFADALQKMEECKKNGNGGGDTEENNIEVLLKAIEEFPHAKHFIMIADNLGKIKDISLLPKVKKPIHIVLARVPRLEFLTLDYVEVALQTQGSLHLNHHDFTTPKDLQDLYQEVKNYREIPKNKNKKRKN